MNSGGGMNYSTGANLNKYSFGGGGAGEDSGVIGRHRF